MKIGVIPSDRSFNFRLGGNVKISTDAVSPFTSDNLLIVLMLDTLSNGHGCRCFYK